MKDYLGEFPVVIAESKFANFTQKDWALRWIEMYGGIDGDHHKMWVIDQIVRILNGAPVEVVEARWGTPENVHTREFRCHVGTCDEYKAWVEEMLGDTDPETGEREYSWDEGCAP